MVKFLDLAFMLLRPLGALYSLSMQVRSALYVKEMLPRTSIGVPVISVGNLAMGGSGKTPIVIFLARLLRQQGWKPAIVSRGYGGHAKEEVNVVCDGDRLLLSSEAGGDEPRLIAESVPGAAVLTGRRRALPCQYAERSLHCDVIILDDGFQHMHVRRDVDLVLFDASALYNNMHVFPGGKLREPFSALKRANCFVITGCTPAHAPLIEQFSELLRTRWPATPLFRADYQPQCLIDRNGKSAAFAGLPLPVAAFCGIAAPRRFRQTLGRLAIAVASFQSFRDHKRYSQEAVSLIERNARAKGARALLTTEKDLVKLADHTFSMPLFAVKMHAEPEPAFTHFILHSLAKASSRYSIATE